MGEDTYGSTHS